MPEPTPSKPTSAKRKGPKLAGGRDARRAAALILEVLAGTLTTAEAAEALQVGLPRYYQLEKRALEGLIQACEPVPRGPGPQKRIGVLERRIRQLEREVARYQALSRTHRQVLGASPAKAPKRGASGKGAPRKRTRKPTVRALKLARAIQAEDGPPILPIPSEESTSTGG